MASDAVADPVRSLGEKIRRAFEQIAKQEDYSDNLQGLCGRAAVQFCLEAEKVGIKARLVHGDGHAYSMLPGNRIVDLTATQFGRTHGAPPDGYEAVEIGQLDSGRYIERYYAPVEVWESVADWLENSKEQLYTARSKWRDDRRVVKATL